MVFKSIEGWYRGKSIFITGGTGYMGKVLVEKILRSIPEIKNIYILVRPKQGKSPRERIASLREICLFAKITDKNPTLMDKIIPIAGDLGEHNLGISEEDRLLLINEVSIVFHLGATLRLELNLKDAINSNTEGTLSMVELCKRFTKLEVFVCVSTAFCHCDISILEEKTYPPTKNPYDIIKMCRENSIAEIKALEASLMAPHPNSYVFSKRLAEAIVNDASHHIPVAIARPSIVLPTMNEPFPGWVDSLNGPIGVTVAAGKGVLRTMYCDQDTYLKVIPVDIAVNAFINIAYKRANNSSPEVVYNVTSGNILTYKQVLDIGRRKIFKYPFEWMLWFPDGSPVKNRFIHNLSIVLFHYLPAYFIDFLLLLFLQKRFMVRVQNKITFGLRLLEYFTTREWYFLNSNALNLESGLSKDEVQKFPISSCLNFDIDKYLEDALYGARTYCLKENPNTLPFCRIYIRL